MFCRKTQALNISTSKIKFCPKSFKYFLRAKLAHFFYQLLLSLKMSDYLGNLSPPLQICLDGLAEEKVGEKFLILLNKNSISKQFDLPNLFPPHCRTGAWKPHAIFVYFQKYK